MVATCAGSVGAHEGHAFLVEAAVSLGGRDVRPGLNVFRFANRIPLLFEGGSDVISQTALNRINWSAYKINQATDRVGVFVSIVSSKIPFKGAGKEYIADDVEVLRNAVRAAIQARPGWAVPVATTHSESRAGEGIDSAGCCVNKQPP